MKIPRSESTGTVLPWSKILLTIVAVTLVYLTGKGTVDLIIDRDFEHLVVLLPAIVFFAWLGVGIGFLVFGMDSILAFPIVIITALVTRKRRRDREGEGDSH